MSTQGQLHHSTCSSENQYLSASINEETDLAEAAVWWEKNLLGALWLEPKLWKEVSELRPSDFLLTEHQQIFGAICAINHAGELADLVSIMAELRKVASPAFNVGYTVAYLVDCEYGCVPENINRYVREVRAAARNRTFSCLASELHKADTVEQRRHLVEAMRDNLAACQ